MAALVFGILALLAFFVPLLHPALAILTGGLALRALHKKRGRTLSLVGVGCALAGLVLHVWVWRFGHLP